MITELDVIEAWKYWHKQGMIPPKVKGINDFKKRIRDMQQYYRNVKPDIFHAAIVVIGRGRNRRWPTMFDINQAIKQQIKLND